jgi:hypothetical protein
MITDIHLKFEGFWGSDGRCHIRFCQAARNLPLVIICSQYTDYSGTSITNAHEIIVQKVFYLIANSGVDGVKFPFDLPLYDEWHHDVGLFEKALVRLFPGKYKHRFLARKLEVEKIFSRIVWLEHYPKDWGGFDRELSCHYVTHNGDGHPIWSNVSDAWLSEKTGMTSQDLLIGGEKLKLERVDDGARQVYQPSEITLKQPGLQTVRWTEHLVRDLPEKLSAHRSDLGQSFDADIPEHTIHDLISRIFVSILPSANFFQREHGFSAALDIKSKKGSKRMDFAIFRPDGKEIDAILEVKRTSSDTRGLVLGVKKDVARLLLLSRRFNCPCYMLVCGNMDIIRSELDTAGWFAFDEHPSFMDRHFFIKNGDLDAEYRDLLGAAKIGKGSTRLQGMKLNGLSSVVLWQVAADMYTLQNNRPYKYDIRSVQ